MLYQEEWEPEMKVLLVRQITYYRCLAAKSNGENANTDDQNNHLEQQWPTKGLTTPSWTQAIQQLSPFPASA